MNHRDRRLAFMVAATFLIAPVICGQEILYRLQPGSRLGHTHVEESGERTIVQVEVEGTFSAFLRPTRLGIGVDIENIDFRSISPQYLLTGFGLFNLEASRVSTTGFPAVRYTDLVVSINDFKNLVLTSELGIDLFFPELRIGVFQIDFNQRKDFFGLQLVAVPAPEFRKKFLRRGDANGDGRVSIADAILILSILLYEKEADCLKAGDVNDDGAMSVVDVIGLLGFLFNGEGIPSGSSLLCSIDSTPDELDCQGQQACMTTDSVE